MKHTGKGGRLGSSCKFASTKECTGDGARDVPHRAWCLGRLSFAPGATADVKNGATSCAKGRHSRAWKKSGLTTKQHQNPTVCGRPLSRCAATQAPSLQAPCRARAAPPRPRPRPGASSMDSMRALVAAAARLRPAPPSDRAGRTLLRSGTELSCTRAGARAFYVSCAPKSYATISPFAR